MALGTTQAVELNALAAGYDTGDCKERNRFGNMTLRLKDRLSRKTRSAHTPY